MATKKEKQELLEVLKFTPVTYKISMWGYGGEKVMGVVDPKVWDYCLKNRFDLQDLAWGDYDELIEEKGLDIDLLPFTPGAWYECDNMAHVNGVSRNAGTLQIENEKGETVYQKSLDSITGGGCDGEPDWCCNDEIWIGMRKKGEVVFLGCSNEKGTFFEGEINLRAPFNIEKLELHYDEVDEEEIVNCVYYDGEEIENWGGSTDGKSSDMYLARIVDDQGNWELYKVPEDDTESQTVHETDIDFSKPSWDPVEELDKIYEAQKSDWFDVGTKPTVKGKYEAVIDAEWPLSGIRMIEWTGRSWKEDGKKIAIKQWRGLKFNPKEV